MVFVYQVVDDWDDVFPGLFAVLDTFEDNDWVVFSAFVLGESFDEEGFHAEVGYPVQVSNLNSGGGMLSFCGAWECDHGVVV